MSDQLLLRHQFAYHLLRDTRVMPTKGGMDPSVSVATVVAIEDFGNRKARILVFVTDMLAGSMVEVAASGKLQGIEQLG